MPTWIRLSPRFAMEARAAVQAHLSALFAEEESQQEPQPEETEVVASPPEGTSSEVRTSTVPLALPVVLPQAEQEELASENVARHDWIAEQGRKPQEIHGLYQRTSDFKVSTTDPDATPMRLKGGGTHLGSHTRLSRRWWQSQDHSARVGDALGRDGYPADARPHLLHTHTTRNCGLAL
jgi:hypothetical protein